MKNTPKIRFVCIMVTGNCGEICLIVINVTKCIWDLPMEKKKILRN